MSWTSEVSASPLSVVTPIRRGDIRVASALARRGLSASGLPSAVVVSLPDRSVPTSSSRCPVIRSRSVWRKGFQAREPETSSVTVLR